VDEAALTALRMRLEQNRRSVAMMPTWSTVSISREQLLDLYAALEVALDRRR
jgi:hypothetical protein